MGIFDFLKKMNDSFFEGVKKNTTERMLNEADSNKEKPLIIKRMEALEKEQQEVDEIIKKYSPPKTKTDKTQKAIKEKERKDLLIEKYGKEVANKIVKKQIFVGMTYEMLKEIKPRHDKKTSTVSYGKETIKLFYGKKKNRLGNDSFDLEITLKEGVVVGWKEISKTGK